MALITNQDSPTPAMVIAALEIHFLPFDTFLSSDHDDNIKNPQYNIYTKTTEAKIHNNQLIVIWINEVTYHNVVE